MSSALDDLVAAFARLSAADRRRVRTFCGAPGDPPDSYPVPDEAHARAALGRAHFSSDPAAVRACVMRVARRRGWPMTASMSAADAPGARALLDRALGVDPTRPEAPWILRCSATDVLFTQDAPDGAPGPVWRAPYQVDLAAGTCVLGVREEVPPSAAGEARFEGTLPAEAPSAQGAPVVPAAVAAALPALPPGWVRRVGPCFRLGSYPDKEFALSAAEADAQIAAFAPIPLEVEHVRSVFDGHLGRLTGIWRDGAVLQAVADLPAWADQAWAAHGRKISAAFDRGSKRLVRAGLVLAPRVADAALMSAFADARARPGDDAPDASLPLIASRAAAAVPGVPEALSMPDLTTWLAAMPAGTTRAELDAALATATFAAPSPREAELITRMSRLEADAQRAEAREAVTTWLHAGWITPAQVPSLVVSMAAALAADAATPATFALGDTQVTRAAALRAAIEAGGARVALGAADPAAVFGQVATTPGEAEAQETMLKEAEATARAYAEKLNRRRA